MNDGLGLRCPSCGCRRFAVYRTRKQQDRVFRERVCEHCGRHVPSYEYLAGNGPRKKEAGNAPLDPDPAS